MNSAKIIGSQLSARDDINTAISDLLADTGLTMRYRLNKIRENVDHPNADVVHKFLDMSFKLDGSYSPEKSVNVNYDVTADILRIKEIEARILELRAMREYIDNENTDDSQ